jgi:hypothetical protein
LTGVIPETITTPETEVKQESDGQKTIMQMTSAQPVTHPADQNPPAEHTPMLITPIEQDKVAVEPQQDDAPVTFVDEDKKDEY